MNRTIKTLLTLATLASTSALAVAGARTEKKGGIAVTLEADGKSGNDGQAGHVFKLVAASSNRKDDKMVDGTIHLLDDGGDEVGECHFSIVVPALARQTDEVLCVEQREWAQFTFELTVGPVPSPDAD